MRKEVAQTTEAYSTRLFERRVREELERLIVRMFKDIEKAVERFLPKTLEDSREQAQPTGSQRLTDAGIPTTTTPLQFSKTLKQLTKKWTEKFEGIAPDIIKRLQKRLVRYINRKYRSLGIEFKTTCEDMKYLMDAKSEEFLSLIVTIPQTVVMNKIKPIVLNSLQQGDRQSVYKQIRKVSNVTKRRARFITRDQIAKNLEAINTGRARQVGLEYYYWDTQMDERVSTGYGGHKQLNGKIFKWDEPEAVIDSYGTKGVPKQRPNCRCRARWIIPRPGYEFKKVNVGYELVINDDTKKPSKVHAPKDIGSTKKYK